MMNTTGFQKVFEERLELARRKNNDYGQKIDNIGSAGLAGIAVRLYDKACRLMSLTFGDVDPKVIDESLRDTLLDAGNYADFGVMIIDGTWGKSSIDQGKKPEEMPFYFGDAVETPPTGSKTPDYGCAVGCAQNIRKEIEHVLSNASGRSIIQRIVK